MVVTLAGDKRHGREQILSPCAEPGDDMRLYLPENCISYHPIYNGIFYIHKVPVE